VSAFASRIPLGLAVVLTLHCGHSLAQMQVPLTPEEQKCGTMVVAKRVSPMDYRTDRKLLLTVEHAHFPPDTENLVKPVFTTFGSDLDYTLHAYPNHHRALVTLMRLGEREKTDQPVDTRYTIECYLRRAIRQANDDTVARMLYARYLMGKKRNEDAMQQLDATATFAGENAFTHYNLGRMLFDLKAYDKAVVHAKRALELGFERQDLIDLLRKQGQWPETPQAAASAAPAGSAPR
jgi:hypothetical protein